MTKIEAFIAKLGTDPLWIALNAHFWFAAFVILLLKGDWWAVAAFIFLAAFKEFWFDAHFETTPPQTTRDNWTDFSGYVAGALAGALTAMYL
jgi:hypothetical protein